MVGELVRQAGLGTIPGPKLIASLTLGHVVATGTRYLEAVDQAPVETIARERVPEFFWTRLSRVDQTEGLSGGIVMSQGFAFLEFEHPSNGFKEVWRDLMLDRDMVTSMIGFWQNAKAERQASEARPLGRPKVDADREANIAAVFDLIRETHQSERSACEAVVFRSFAGGKNISADEQAAKIERLRSAVRNARKYRPGKNS